jgi:hypothetical protein
MQLLSLQRNSFRTSLLMGAGLAGMLGSAVPMRARAQAADTLAARELSAGVAYRHFVDKTGPWNVHGRAISSRDGSGSRRWRVALPWEGPACWRA